MKRIIVVCEGQTEREFCRSILSPHFSVMGIGIQPPLIAKSGGGMVKWTALKKQIENHLRQDKSAWVTTLIDYYGIREQHQFPDWDLAQKNWDKTARMTMLEAGIKREISEEFRYRFVPYIQLHEFEGLLFNEMSIFRQQFTGSELKNPSELSEIIEENPNPELINDSPDNAPSKRLERLIRGYNKVLHGSMLAEAIGLEKIRAKCPRFNEWLTTLERI